MKGRLGGCVMLAFSRCLWVCLFTAAATAAGFEICRRGVVIAGGVDVGVVFPATVLCTSLVSCAI